MNEVCHEVSEVEARLIRHVQVYGGCHTSQLREETARWNFAGGMPIYTEGASVRSEIKQFCNSLRTSFLSIMVHISDDDPLMVGRQDY